MKQYEWFVVSVFSSDRKLLRIFFFERCSFTFDPDNFPDPKAYIAEIKAKYGVKVCVWSEFSFTSSDRSIWL